MIDCLKRRLPSYTNSGIAEKIDDLIHDKMDREILRRKLIDNATLEEISVLLDAPLSTVRDHYYNGLNILFPRK